MKKCELCGKGSRMVGHRKLLRGHYNPTNWSRKYPNLQRTTTPKGEKVLACTKCMRTFTKESRIVANKEKREKLAQQKAVEAKVRAERRKAVEAKKAKASATAKNKTGKKDAKKEKPKTEKKTKPKTKSPKKSS